MVRTLYSIIGLMAMTLSASAQLAQPSARYSNKLPQQPNVIHQEPERPHAGLQLRGDDIVWSEDFDNGLAGNNPSGPWTTDGPNGNIWRVGTTAPRGFYTPNNQIIGSTTASNGFAKFASDSANCTWNGNTPTALPQASFTNWEGSLVSPVIDLSATPNVEIVFQQRSRYCCGDSPFFLEFSLDGGATWPQRVQANGDIAANQSPTFTETRRFDISGVLAEGASNFRFRFRHDSEAETSHYQWQVDDINIALLPDYEIAMNYGYTSQTGDGEEYGRTPIEQMNPVLNIGAEVHNYGNLDQTNVTVTCVITDELDNVVLTEDTLIGTIVPGDTVVVDQNVTLPPLSTQLYTATFTVTSDQIDFDQLVDNNERVRTFAVTNDLYSLDNLGNHPAGLQTAAQYGTASFTDNAENVKFMVMYILREEMTVTGIEIDLGSSTDVDSRIIVSILDTTDVLSSPSVVNNPVDGAQSDDYFITAQDVAAGVVGIPLLEPVTLAPGAYYACASLFQEGDSVVTLVDDTTVPQPALASVLWIPFDPENNQNLYGGNGTAWAVRLTSSLNVAVAEGSDLPGVGMFPNPTDGLLRVNTTGGTFSLEVINMLGEVLMTDRFAGNTVVDLSALASGVYHVRVSDGARSTVQRIARN